MDIAVEDRHQCLLELAQFCGATPDMDFIEDYSAWEKVGSTNKGEEKVPDTLIHPLKFAHEWYQYYTENWGRHFRHSMNTLGEGD
jgi:hypothetical protein